MAILQGLQGLLGGLNSGLSGFLDQRQQAMENDQKARALAVQEAEQKRMEKSQIWTQRKAAYDALMNPTDEATARPFVEQGLPMIKNPDGTYSRPQSAAEQFDLGRVEDQRLDLSGRQFLMNNPQELAKPIDQLRQLYARLGMDPSTAPSSLSDISAEATAKFAPQAANANLQRTHDVQIQGMRDAADLRQTQMTTDASRYGADQMRLRMTGDDADINYNRFKTTYLSNPVNTLDYNKTVRELGAEAAERALITMYKTTQSAIR